MKLMTWNVQWCRGVDGRVDPARIVAEARRIADFDVLCLQEIADNFPDPELAGSAGDDQFAVLAGLLPGYTAVPGVAVDQPGRNGARRRFGNMILSRLPVRQVYRHALPYPLDPGVPGMPRLAVEAVVARAVRRGARDHDAPRVLLGEAADGAGRRRCGASTRKATRTRATRRITKDDGAPFHTFVRPARDDHHRRLQLRAGRSRAPADAARRSTTARRRCSTRGSSRTRASRTRRRSASTRRPIPAAASSTATSSSSATS